MPPQWDYDQDYMIGEVEQPYQYLLKVRLWGYSDELTGCP